MGVLARIATVVALARGKLVAYMCEPSAQPSFFFYATFFRATEDALRPGVFQAPSFD